MNSHFRPPGPDVSLTEAARILGTDKRTVLRLLAQRDLEAYQLGARSIRVRRESILTFRERVIPASRFERGGA
ncbi:MAG: helix-turn-helix domain-containing protein [Chromatiaceae bacterium]|nr:helix-turn-helix domain-containing protein [Chromatiaceae bacterium]